MSVAARVIPSVSPLRFWQLYVCHRSRPLDDQTILAIVFWTPRLKPSPALFTASSAFDLQLLDFSRVTRKQLGKALVRAFLDRWETRGVAGDLPALLRLSVTHPDGRAKAIEVFINQVKPMIEKASTASDPAKSAGLIATQLVGICFLTLCFVSAGRRQHQRGRSSHPCRTNRAALSRGTMTSIPLIYLFGSCWRVMSFTSLMSHCWVVASLLKCRNIGGQATHGASSSGSTPLIC